MKLEAVCTKKTLAIGFSSFPKRICSYEGHDALNDLLVVAIPEIDRQGFDGGFYRQTMHVWITIECEGMTDAREREIRTEFVRILKAYCKLK